MDYHRIYSDFIKDRRAKEPTLDGYVERHHILPRSLGGGDEPDNLINLTAEDHYFAHLLLAKMHGGRLSSAAYLLAVSCNGTWTERNRLRGRYGLAKRMSARLLSEAMAGDANHLFNAHPYEWLNYRTGAEETATLYEMHQRHGASRGSWTQVAKGDRPSIKGWLLKIRSDDHKRSEKGQIFHFVHRDGRRFSGTQTELCAHSGMSDAAAWRLVHKNSVSKCGWRRVGSADKIWNGPKDGRRSSAVGRGRTYRLFHWDGRAFAGTSEDFRVLMGKPEGFSMSVRLSGLMRGAQKTLYGWAIDQEKTANKGRTKLPLD